MSIQLSRRDFMKCSAVAVLAAASGTLLTGCSGGAGGSIPADQPISKDGLTVEMERWNDSKHPVLGKPDYDNFITIGDYQLLDLTFELKNNTDKSISIVDAPHVTVGKLLTAVGTCISTQKPDALFKYLQEGGTFTVTADNKPVSCVFYFENDIDTLLTPTKLHPRGDVDVHLLCLVPANWSKLNISYNTLGLNFVQSRN